MLVILKRKKAKISAYIVKQFNTTGACGPTHYVCRGDLISSDIFYDKLTCLEAK